MAVTKKVTTPNSPVDNYRQELECYVNEAVASINQSAAQASGLIIQAATDAIKSLTKPSDDHDLLIELKTRMEGIKTDISSLTNNTAGRITDHETRIAKLESTRNSQSVLLSIGIGILTLLVGMLTYHLFKM